MAVIVANGCFDLLHEGHTRFLTLARGLGDQFVLTEGKTMLSQYFARREVRNRLVVAVNSDACARKIKFSKWGEKYPIDDLETRMAKLSRYADEVVAFDSEAQLHELIEWLTPCILVKGPDYVGKAVTGDDIAPVIILDTPEPESVKQMKLDVYGIAAKR
jgi:D-beta-D-heptose 7-phosphate kinase / D-beta-D-heptose 1-phosphate adenosyltransferase